MVINEILDGSTDKSGIEKMVLYLRYIPPDNLVKETFLTMVPSENATADSYSDAITKEMTKLGLPDWFSFNSVWDRSRWSSQYDWYR